MWDKYYFVRNHYSSTQQPTTLEHCENVFNVFSFREASFALCGSWLREDLNQAPKRQSREDPACHGQGLLVERRISWKQPVRQEILIHCPLNWLLKKYCWLTKQCKKKNRSIIVSNIFYIFILVLIFLLSTKLIISVFYLLCSLGIRLIDRLF